MKFVDLEILTTPAIYRAQFFRTKLFARDENLKRAVLKTKWEND